MTERDHNIPTFSELRTELSIAEQIAAEVVANDMAANG